MRWNYNDEFRDEFGKGPHRDILIVPHGTKVTPVAGGPPEITSRVPLFNDDGTPQTSGGNFVMSDVDWVITNKDIVKEQFKYSYSLNPAENITFSSASSAMVQFTIRNNKEYNPDTDTWELDIPNLQYYSYYDKNNNLIIGELEGNYIIKVYTYINGDSSTLLCLGMFRVEEDKTVDNGYNRQITAYDFMATFRDMDIFNWYKRLFDGINKLDNDYIDATNKSGEEQKKPDNYDAEVNWVRKPSKKLYPDRDGRWTVKDALEDLINNLAAFDMIVWSDDGKTAMVGGTSTNPSAVGRDYGEGCGYSGYGMPIVIDPNILDKNTKPYTPTEPGQDEYEEYGYMKILELEFYPDPSVLKSESLSMGKFLEDIGILAGRYPMIRPDKLIEDQTADYFDPRTVTDPKQTRYNTYEKCILTFKPLPTSKDDKTDAGVPKLQPEQQLSNHEIVKGFQHALFDVKDVMIVKIGMQDGEKIEYKILNKTQRKQAETNDLQTFTFSNNLFCSYLVDSSDDDEIKKLLPEYKKIKEKLFGKEKDNHNMTSGALFEDGYYNIKNRSYVPYTLTTYGDPVRDVGDRILINFEDKITGEKTQMYTYILERELSGIQKMMDTYKANGQITSPVFSNYQAGTHYQSGFGMNIQMLGYKHSYGKGSGTGGDGSSQGKVVGVSPSDLVSYLRNVGIRLLDEPLVASAKFVQGGESGDPTTEHYIYNISGGETSSIKDGDTTNPILYEPGDGTGTKEVTVTPGDYVYWVDYYQNDDPAVPQRIYYPLYVYTFNNEWKYAGATSEPGCNYYSSSGADVKLDEDDGSFVDGSTCGRLILSPKEEQDSFYRGHQDDDIIYYAYGNFLWQDESISETITVEAHIGDYYCVDLVYDDWWYQYPGIWIKNPDSYPKLDVPIVINTKKYVALKWEDPGDIETWEPTPADWKGTIVIRKEDSAPKHRWDGEEIVRTTTSNKDAYKDTAYKDEDIQLGKTYYYGFFPYYKKREQDGHNINFFRFTKVIKVETGVNAKAPTIVDIYSDNNTVMINYIIPSGEYNSIKIYGKIGEIPSCDNTDDVVSDVDATLDIINVNNLEYESEYYFCIKSIDNNNVNQYSNVESITIGEEPERILINLGPSNRTAWIASTNTTGTNFITRYSPDSLFPEGKDIVYSTGLNKLIYETEVEYEVQLYAYEWIDQYYFEMLAYNQIYVNGAWTGTYSRFKYYLIDPNVDYFLNIVQPEITLHSKVVESAIDSTYGKKINLVKDNQLHKINIKLIYVNIDNGCSAGTIIRLSRIKYYLDDTIIDTISLPGSSGQYIITGGIVTNRTGYEMAGINNYLRFYSNLSDIYTRTDLSSLQDIKMNYFYNTIEYLDKDNVFTVLKDDPFILNYLKRPNSFGLGPISSERAFTSLIEKPGIDFANYLQEIIDGSTAYNTEYTVFSDDVLTVTILNQPSSNDMKIRVFSNKPVIPERSDSLDQSTTVSIGEYNYYKETLHDTMYIYAVFYTFPNARMSQIEFIFDTPASSSPTGRSSSARLPVTGMSRSLDNPFCSPDPRYTTEYNKGNKNISRPLCTSLYEYYHPHDSYDSGYTLPPNQYDIIKSFKLKIKNEYEDRFVDKTTVLLDYLNGIKHEIFDSFYVKNDGWSLNVTSAGKPYLWATSVYKDYWTGTIAPAGVIIKIKPNSIMYLYAILEMVKSPNYEYTQYVGLGWYRLTKSSTEEDTYYIRSGDYQIRDGFIYPTDQFCGNPMPTSDKRVVMEYMYRNYSQTEPIYLIPNISMDTQPLMGKMTANALQFFVIKMALVGDVEFVHGTVKYGN